MHSRGRLWARFLIGSGSVCILAFIAWVTLQIISAGLGYGREIASIVSMYVALATFPLTVTGVVVSLRRSPPAAAVTSLDKDLDAVAEVLAVGVRGQLEAEERIRRIHDPFPLPVRWSAALTQLMDHWENVHGSASQSAAIPLAGRGDHIVDLFTRIPSRRLTVLGRAGAGKTIVASRFVLTLLDRRTSPAEGPVPVLLSAGLWDPSAASLRTWAAEQLASDYPVLAQRDSRGSTFAAGLLATRRVMIVLAVSTRSARDCGARRSGRSTLGWDRVNGSCSPAGQTSLPLPSRPAMYSLPARLSSCGTSPSKTWPPTSR